MRCGHLRSHRDELSISLFRSDIRSWTSGVILMRGTVETGRMSIEHHRGGLPDDAARGRPGDMTRIGMVASTGRARMKDARLPGEFLLHARKA